MHPPRLDGGMAEHHNNTDQASILRVTSDNANTHPMQSNNVTMSYGWDCSGWVQSILLMGHPPHAQ